MTIRQTFKFLPVLGFALLAQLAHAQATPVGLWKTIDDDTHQAKSWVRIADQGGVLTGRIEKLLDPAKQDARCDKCTDGRKDQPVAGMTILSNVKQSSADAALWEGGEILDPNNGKTYRVRLKPMEAGKSLEVRGYIGPFYRNQTWIRVE
ncbi:MAG: DUF2147 domain-containing protein [Burkholderiaceae bacterium]